MFKHLKNHVTQAKTTTALTPAQEGVKHVVGAFLAAFFGGFALGRGAIFPGLVSWAVAAILIKEHAEAKKVMPYEQLNHLASCLAPLTRALVEVAAVPLPKEGDDWKSMVEKLAPIVAKVPYFNMTFGEHGSLHSNRPKTEYKSGTFAQLGYRDDSLRNISRLIQSDVVLFKQHATALEKRRGEIGKLYGGYEESTSALDVLADTFEYLIDQHYWTAVLVNSQCKKLAEVYGTKAKTPLDATAGNEEFSPELPPEDELIEQGICSKRLRALLKANPEEMVGVVARLRRLSESEGDYGPIVEPGYLDDEPDDERALATLRGDLYRLERKGRSLKQVAGTEGLASIIGKTVSKLADMVSWIRNDLIPMLGMWMDTGLIIIQPGKVHNVYTAPDMLTISKGLKAVADAMLAVASTPLPRKGGSAEFYSKLNRLVVRTPFGVIVNADGDVQITKTFNKVTGELKSLGYTDKTLHDVAAATKLAVEHYAAIKPKIEAAENKLSDEDGDELGVHESLQLILELQDLFTHHVKEIEAQCKKLEKHYGKKDKAA